MANEEMNLGFNLTLDPVGAAAAVAEAPAPEEAVAAEPEKEIPVEKLDIEKLSAAEQSAVREFSKKIDVTDSAQILNYGSNAQKNISDFSAQALGQVRTKDMGQVGEMLTDLVSELNGLETRPEDKKGILGFFRKTPRSIADLKNKYDKAEVNVDKICTMLDGHYITLQKDIVTLDQMHEMNQQYFKELSMYIIAGKLRLEELRSTELVTLQEKAKESNLPEDAQAANDYANLLSRFEKKLHDLELTRMISIQMGPQIRMIQNNDALMAEKIQTAIANTIPLWKQQMVLALSMYHSQQAMEATRSVNDVTNDLLKKNAEALRMGSVDVARESERGIVDMETLAETNRQLIATLEDVRAIQEEGRARRAEAETELGRLEGELKMKLLEIKG